jgi:type IV secretion system protein VirD4
VTLGRVGKPASPQHRLPPSWLMVGRRGSVARGRDDGAQRRDGSLPVLMAEGGGTGITTMPVRQSLSRARSKWSDHAASTIWDASIVKVILGGPSASKDLQELSVLIGERDERSDSVTISDYGARSIQHSTRRVAVMPPERIRTLPFGTGLVLLRSAPPIVTSFRSRTNR